MIESNNVYFHAIGSSIASALSGINVVTCMHVVTNIMTIYVTGSSRLTFSSDFLMLHVVTLVFDYREAT